MKVSLHKFLLLALMVLLPCTILKGASDSLLQQILSKPEGNEKLYGLINYANKHLHTAPFQSLQAASKALELSFKLKDKRAEAYAYTSLGALNYHANNYPAAIDYFEKAKSLFKQIGETEGEMYSLKYLGFAHEKLKNYEQSLKYLEVYENKSNSKLSASENANLKISKARSYESTRQPEKAKIEIEKADKLAAELSPSDRIALYAELGEISALSSDSIAITYLNKSVNLANEINPQLSFKSFSNLEKIYTKQGNIAKANETERQKISALMTATPTDWNLKPDVFYKNFSLDTIPNNLLSLHAETMLELGKYHEKKGQIEEALFWYKNYMKAGNTNPPSNLSDSIEKSILIGNLQTNEERIKALENNRLAQRKVIRFQTTLMWVLSLGILMVIAALYWVWKVNKKQKVANLKLRFQSLTNRMNPHFIYNSLNSVNLFIAQNQEKEANKFLSDFSKLMRKVLEYSAKENISLAEELQLVSSYIKLEHSRFGEHFSYTIQTDPSLEIDAILVPPMVLQPYVENAIWHGLRYREESGAHLEIEIKQEKNYILCSISDNGIGREKSSALKTKNQKEHQSIGLKNTSERVHILNQLFKQNISIEITDLEPSHATYPGTWVRFYFPILLTQTE
jgi:hypothetical protein